MKSNRIGKLLTMAVGAAGLTLFIMACSSPTLPDQTDVIADPIVVNGLPGGRIELAIQGTKPGTAAAASKSLFNIVSAKAVTSIDLPVTGIAGSQIGSLTLTEARLSLKEFKFKLAEEEVDTPEEESENDSIELEGPYVVDLIADTVTPPLDLVDVIAGVYKEIEMKLDKIEGDEEDEEGATLVDTADTLFDRSIYIEGTYSDTLATLTDVPFVLTFEIDEEFSLTGLGDTSEGIVIDQNMLNHIIIAFRINKWFDFSNPETANDVDFTDLTVDPLVGIVLDESIADSTAEEIHDVIKENIKESADYGEDEDKSGELEPDEDDDPDEEDEDDD